MVKHQVLEGKKEEVVVEAVECLEDMHGDKATDQEIKNNQIIKILPCDDE